eukprot:Gb_23474 [translate_table: standard]
MTGKRIDGVKKPLHRRRKQFVKAMKEFLTCDSYMYGPLLYPNNYRTSPNAAAHRPVSSKGPIWQTKRTNVAISSLKIQKASNYQSARTAKSVCDGDERVNFGDNTAECFKKAKYSTPSSVMDHIFEPDTPTAEINRVIENEKMAVKDSSHMRL